MVLLSMQCHAHSGACDHEATPARRPAAVEPRLPLAPRTHSGDPSDSDSLSSVLSLRSECVICTNRLRAGIFHRNTMARKKMDPFLFDAQGAVQLDDGIEDTDEETPPDQDDQPAGPLPPPYVACCGRENYLRGFAQHSCGAPRDPTPGSCSHHAVCVCSARGKDDGNAYGAQAPAGDDARTWRAYQYVSRSRSPRVVLMHA